MNSTIAYSLVASKFVSHSVARLLFRSSIAGARRGWLAKRGLVNAEEINRVLTDILGDRLFKNEENAIGNLRREGI